MIDVGRVFRPAVLRRGFLVLVAGLVLGGVLEQRWPVRSRPSTRMALAGVHVYQNTLSRLYAQVGVRCRFTPTCSRYSEAVIGRFGLWQGGWLTARRIVRCGPWTAAGTRDPAPAG